MELQIPSLALSEKIIPSGPTLESTAKEYHLFDGKKGLRQLATLSQQVLQKVYIDGKPFPPQDKVSEVVAELTPWEAYLNVLSKRERATNICVETDKDGMFEPESMAHAALLWMYDNNNHPNQPLKVVFKDDGKTIDVRKKADAFRAAVRLHNGNYKVIRLNEQALAEKDMVHLFEDEGGEDMPTNVQVVVDNRQVGNADCWDLNTEVPSSLVAIASSGKGEISINADHLAMEGVLIHHLGAEVGRFSNIKEDGKIVIQRGRDSDSYEPAVVDLELSEMVKGLNSEQIFQVYGKAMIAYGFKKDETVLVPAIAKPADLSRDPSYSRIQPTLARLSDLADDPKGVVDRIRKITLQGKEKSPLYHVFKTLHDPRIPKWIQKQFIHTLKHLPIGRDIVRIYDGVGLISTPAIPQSKGESVFSRLNMTPVNTVTQLSGNTMKSMVDSNAINLNITTRKMGLKGNEVCVNLSGPKGSQSVNELTRFASLMKDEIRKLEEVK